MFKNLSPCVHPVPAHLILYLQEIGCAPSDVSQRVSFSGASSYASSPAKLERRRSDHRLAHNWRHDSLSWDPEGSSTCHEHVTLSLRASASAAGACTPDGAHSAGGRRSCRFDASHDNPPCDELYDTFSVSSDMFCHGLAHSNRTVKFGL